MNQKECEDCYFYKVRDVDPETNTLEFGPFCLQTEQPVRCEIAVKTCELKEVKK